MAELTVLMTVYNGALYLKETIESVLNQTYKDFIFLILDNASTDNSREIVLSYDDPRIRLEALPRNIGQVAALNKGLDMIDTPLVARLDADDICLPRRLERQVEFMKEHPEIGVSGTFVKVFQQQDGKEIDYYWPTQPEDIKVKLLFECCLPHPGVIIRKAFFDRYELRYDENIGHSFDWELWQRAAQYFPLANLPEYHLRYRLHPENESKKTLHLQEQAALQLDRRSLKQLGLENHPLRSIHRQVAFETFNAEKRESGYLDQVVQWFRELENANNQKQIYSEMALKHFLKERLFWVLNFNTGQTAAAAKIFFKEKLYKQVGILRSLKFMVKLLLSTLRSKNN